jgi:hypothetical protein
MVPPIFRLPPELRLQIWDLVLGPQDIRPCMCMSTPEICKSAAPERCYGGYDVRHAFNKRLLLTCRVIYREACRLLSASLKRLIVCNVLCLRTFLSNVEVRDRNVIKRMRVNLYIGDISEKELHGRVGIELLRRGEASCGMFIRSALQCQGVGTIVDLVPLEDIKQDELGRRLLNVEVSLA